MPVCQRPVALSIVWPKMGVAAGRSQMRTGMRKTEACNLRRPVLRWVIEDGFSEWWGTAMTPNRRQRTVSSECGGPLRPRRRALSPPQRPPRRWVSFGCGSWSTVFRRSFEPAEAGTPTGPPQRASGSPPQHPSFVHYRAYPAAAAPALASRPACYFLPARRVRPSDRARRYLRRGVVRVHTGLRVVKRQSFS